jgi:hypothetical protein
MTKNKPPQPNFICYFQLDRSLATAHSGWNICPHSEGFIGNNIYNFKLTGLDRSQGLHIEDIFCL